MERAKEASSLAHKIETESIQVKLTTVGIFIEGLVGTGNYIYLYRNTN